MRPNFCQIKRVERKLFGLLECHHLNEHGVRRKVSFGNGIVKITNGKVGIVSRHVVCLLPIKAFDTLICLVMKLRKNPLKLRTILRKAKDDNLDIDRIILGIDHFESVRTIPVHMTVTLRCSTVTEEERDLVR